MEESEDMVVLQVVLVERVGHQEAVANNHRVELVATVRAGAEAAEAKDKEAIQCLAPASFPMAFLVDT